MLSDLRGTAVAVAGAERIKSDDAVCEWNCWDGCRNSSATAGHLDILPTCCQGYRITSSSVSVTSHHFLPQGHCGACRRKWRLTDTDLCPCGETQTMFHIVKSCPLTKLNGGLSRLHSADENAVSWLTSYGSWNAYKKIIIIIMLGEGNGVSWAYNCYRAEDISSLACLMHFFYSLWARKSLLTRCYAYLVTTDEKFMPLW